MVDGTPTAGPDRGLQAAGSDGLRDAPQLDLSAPRPLAQRVQQGEPPDGPSRDPLGAGQLRSGEVIRDLDFYPTGLPGDAVPLGVLSRAGRDGLRLAVAESLTSGQLSRAVGTAAHASDWFMGGIVVYHLSAKQSILAVTPGTDPCSASCAIQLAVGARHLFGSDLAVSTTGVGGPDSQDGHEPGTVFIGWASPNATGHQELRLSGDPDAVLRQTVEHALATVADVAEELAAAR